MPEQQAALTGKVTHIFAHRFVVVTSDGPVLADLTPRGAEQITLCIGDTVRLEGEMKPSELKVSQLVRDGKAIHLEHKHKHDHHPHADPHIAITAARELGFEPVGDPHRKPKHFEVLGRKGGKLIELHIELDGHLRKTKPVDGTDHKWRSGGTRASIA